ISFDLAVTGSHLPSSSLFLSFSPPLFPLSSFSFSPLPLLFSPPFLFFPLPFLPPLSSFSPFSLSPSPLSSLFSFLSPFFFSLFSFSSL
ncbi:hypothetical protein ACXWR7_10930, partial [Streptococcus pyogenes]